MAIPSTKGLFSTLKPLAKEEVGGGAPAREVAYYGGVRKGFEAARAGIEEVIQHLSGLLTQNPDNVRLERYLRQLNKLLTKLHKLQMRSSRVRDRRVERKQPQGQPQGWQTHEFPGSRHLSPGPDPDEEREHDEKFEMVEDDE